MRVEVLLPQWGMGMAEGTVLAWHVAVGEAVTEGQPLVEVETAKATAAVDAPATGRLIEVAAAPGTVAAVYSVLGVIET